MGKYSSSEPRKKDRHADNGTGRRKKYGRSYVPHRLYGEFVAIDGEGVGNDYVLLDSSTDFPRLYERTGTLNTIAILDWLWGLARHPSARGKDFVLYGAGYDYNNWVRILSLNEVRRFAAGDVVFIGDYVIQWMKGYKFELRKLARAGTKGVLRGWRAKREIANHIEIEGTRYQTLPDKRIGIVFWDVLPFLQKTFVKGVKDVLGEVPALIEEGKAARGSFTHENIEWVSEYNKLECKLLVRMMENLRDWFRAAGIELKAWNGPGAAAKALLRNYPWQGHSGRYVSPTGRTGGYLCPHRILTTALNAYAGGRNQLLKIGTVEEAWEYDIVSAYPSAMVQLPCLTHGDWEYVTDFEPYSFGMWDVSYESTRTVPTDHANLYPFFARSHNTGRIHYPYRVDHRWSHTAEVVSALQWDRMSVRVHGGWVWRPYLCDNPFPLSWVRDSFRQRKQYKDKESRLYNPGASLAIKLALNSLYGSFAQGRGGTLEEPPPTQQLIWAGAITATIRAKLLDAGMNAEADICHMATDGIISLSPLPVDIGDNLGQWEVQKLTNLMLVQYGVYFADQKARYRGFSVDEDKVGELRASIEQRWTGTAGYYELSVPQRYFVTDSLVSQGLADFDDWCTWQEREERLDLWTRDNEHTVTKPKNGQLLSMVEFISPSGAREWTADPNTRFDSADHAPKWGKGMNFPNESALEDAYMAAREA